LSNYPKPSFVISESNFSLVWFGSTNHFLVVEDTLQKFFSEAVVQIESEYQESLEVLIEMYPEITGLMQVISIHNTSTLTNDTKVEHYKQFKPSDFKSSNLIMGQNIVTVYYDSRKLQTIFEAPFTYLKSNQTKVDKELAILEIDNTLSLLSGKELIYTTPKDQFFVLQAQFANKLIEFYHNISSPNWLCAFHGCAIQKNNKTFLLLGDSGAGKSTLSTLLSLSNYRFIADDLVLMDHDFKLYDNPAAVSVKENSWPIIENYYKAFENLKTSKKVKGHIKMKFLPMHALQKNTPQSFNVDALVWVNYSTDQINHLSRLDKQEALSRLIPDTWINSELNSAKAFANWAINIKTYHLDYHDFNIAKKLFDAQLY
jgi:serine kinase of HPr protein (carbohydrate metabolism regulator)